MPRFGSNADVPGNFLTTVARKLSMSILDSRQNSPSYGTGETKEDRAPE